MSLSTHKVNCHFSSPGITARSADTEVVEVTSVPGNQIIFKKYCPAEIPKKYFVKLAGPQTPEVYNPFKDLILEEIKNMKNLELKNQLSEILNLDNGIKLDKPLSSWLVYIVEFFDCHYSNLGIISSSQRDTAIEIISKYLPEDEKQKVDFLNSYNTTHPIELWESNKSKIKKLLSNEPIEESAYLIPSEVRQLKEGIKLMKGGAQLRYNYLVDIYFDTAHKRQWFNTWITNAEQNLTKEQKLSDKQLEELNYLLINIKHTDWTTAEINERLLKLTKSLGYNVKVPAKRITIHTLPDLRMMKEIDTASTKFVYA
ncbi:MAG: hypothetical protein HY094_07670 [Candidatus Melainabacteria bacterium]|nr:hypothetical protein [Candidatus Melainabacteria bacterium]